MGLLLLAQRVLKPSDLFLCLLPMFHTFAWMACILIPLRLGASVAITPAIVPPKLWLQMMRKYGVTIFGGVPQLYAVLASEAHSFKRLYLKYLCFRNVRFCISGAAPLSPKIPESFESRLGVPILEGYGLTETSPVVCANRPGARKIGTVGQALPGVRVKIIDESENVLPVGGEGEVCVQGPNVMKGYYNLPQATQQSFTRDGWFKTGDIGVLDPEGYLTIRDRKKDMIIVKGLKVFPVMVEEVLLSHPSVAEAAVVGIPDSTGDEIIKAFVTLKQNQPVEKSELLKLCRKKLAPYQCPRDLEIRDSLPKNALQKILKRELRREEMEKNSCQEKSLF